MGRWEIDRQLKKGRNAHAFIAACEQQPLTRGVAANCTRREHASSPLGFEVSMRISTSYALYGRRSPLQLDCYQPMPGWLLIAIGSLTLEVRWTPRQRGVRAR
jgi:hypothetical protein